MSSVFGKKNDTVAKSWSDMFEEDEEESSHEAELQSRREQNSRSWSQDSHHRLPVPPGVLTESKSRSSSNARRSRTRTPRPTSPLKASGGSNENDPFGWRVRTPRHSPQQVPVDKWAALGHKRRNMQPDMDHTPRAGSTKKRSMTTGSRKRSSNGPGLDQVWHRRDSRTKARPAYLQQDWRQAKVMDSSPTDEDDHEWVGGWHNFHL